MTGYIFVTAKHSNGDDYINWVNLDYVVRVSFQRQNQKICSAKINMSDGTVMEIDKSDNLESLYAVVLRLSGNNVMSR